jgi:hypothetical protein
MYRHTGARMGQICLPLAVKDTSQHKVGDNALEDHQVTPWLHRHYARLIEDISPMILKDNGKLKSDEDDVTQDEWNPVTKFPSFEEDMLLHLVMIGTKNHRALFCDANKIEECPYRCAVYELFNDIESRRSLNHGVFTRKSTPWEFWELLLHMCTVLASRKNGVHGIRLVDFFKHLVYELYPRQLQFKNVHLENQQIIEQLDKFKDFVMPFLSSPEMKFPKFIRDEWPRLSNSRYTANKEMIDGRFARPRNSQNSGGGNLEAKYRSKNVDLKTMSHILAVAGKSSQPLTLALVTQLQGEYFTGKTIWAEFQKKHKLERCFVARLSISGKAVEGNNGQTENHVTGSFGEIKGIVNGVDEALTHNKFEKLVVFVECPLDPQVDESVLVAPEVEEVFDGVVLDSDWEIDEGESRNVAGGAEAEHRNVESIDDDDVRQMDTS